MMKSKWIVVADASRARVYSLPTAQTKNFKKSIKLEQQLQHPESRLKTSELASDERGRNLDRNASLAGQAIGGAPHEAAQRSAAEQHKTPHDVEAERFARELVEFVNHARAENKFEELVVIAPPQFLGTLRQTMDEPLAKTVVKSIDKDLTFVPDHEMPDRLEAMGLE